MINGSFTSIQINGRYLWIKRNDNGLWDLTGGGFNVDEIDYKGVVRRETIEEIGVDLARKQFRLGAVLGQRLKADISAQYGGIQYGLVFGHCSILYEMPDLKIGDEHSDWELFTYGQIIKNYKKFSSGMLWLFFALQAYQQTHKLQEGMLYDRRIWQGKEYR